ncbi:DUF721 domain-containing protein [bacterium]|jgi:hypothetical protein|nr:DUF721 domain-containing protein [bacterium]MBT5014947.1 DUF721 domain-containing protein [bacterium]
MASLIDSLMKTALPQQQTWQLFLIKNWKTIIGNLSQHVRLEKIFKTTVILGVYDPHWMQELHLFSNILLDKINDALDKPEVTQLRFKKVNRKNPNLKGSTKKTYTPIPVELSDKENKALDTIDDPELNEVLKKFLIRCHRQKKILSWNKKKKR